MTLCHCGRYFEGDWDECAYCRPSLTRYHGPAPMRRADWMGDANCRDMDTDLFFDADWRTRAVTERKLRVVCMACRVRKDCLDDILHFESFHGDGMREGFQGGMTAAERAQEARRRRVRSENAVSAFGRLREALG